LNQEQEQKLYVDFQKANGGDGADVSDCGQLEWGSDEDYVVEDDHHHEEDPKK
jgi:hypothetical protein